MGEPSPEMKPLQTTQAAAAGQGSGSSNETRRRVVKPPLEWTPEKVDRLISERGIHDVIDEDGQPIYWDAVKKGQYDCADMLLDYAKNEGIVATFRRDGDDLLLWAIENDAHGIVRFILEKLTEKYASVDETSSLLAKHLLTIGERCPEMLADLLKNDKFTIEYARFQVPKAVFDNNEIPKTMITRTVPDNWAEMEDEQEKGLWIEHWEENAHSIGTTSDAQIMVTAKVFCYRRLVPPKKPNVLLSYFLNLFDLVICREPFWKYLHNLGLPVVVFESETLVNFIDHWFRVYRPYYHISIILQAAATLTFTIFALTFRQSTNETEEAHSKTLQRVVNAIIVLRVLERTFFQSVQRLTIANIELVLLTLFMYSNNNDRDIKLSAFLTSVICLVQWILMFLACQPFEGIGTFVSMVSSVVSHSWRFLLLLTLLIVGYASAFVALFRSGSVGDDEENFISFLRAIETLLYACLGNFEVDMFRSSNSFLAIWATLLFASFIYILPVVLISVLIAIVQDIFDRTRLKEKAELRKLRLQIVAQLRPTVDSDEFDTTDSGPNEGRAALLLYRLLRSIFKSVCKRILSLQLTRTTSEVYEDTIERAYFHYLVPEVNGIESRDGEWQGKLVAIERTIKSEAQKTERSLKEHLSLVDKKMDKLTAQISKLDNEATENKLLEESWRCHVEERMDRLEAATSKLQTVMDKIL